MHPSDAGRAHQPCDAVLGSGYTHFLHEQALQLLTTILQPLFVRGIHDPDERVRLFKVVLPICAQCLLPTDVPWGG
jgi:hypothetical protein